MMGLLAVLLAGLMSLVSVRADFVEIFEKHQNKGHWKKLGLVQALAEHEVVFAVRQANLGQLEEELFARSTPGSHKYGLHMGFEEVGQMIATKAPAKRVAKWIFANIAGAALVKTSHRGEYMRIRTTVASLEKALNTSFSYWKSDMTGKVSVRCEKYYLPKSLTTDLHAIFGTTDFPPMIRQPPQFKEMMNLSANDGSYDRANNYISPAILNSFYKINSNVGSAEVSQAVFESSGQTYSPEDLTTFQEQFSLPTEQVSTDVGGHASNSICETGPNNCTEANLDVQYMMAVSQKTPMTYYYVGNEEDPFVAFVESIAAETNPPLVNSISYGSVESEISSSTMEAFNNEVMKLGVMGVSVFVSSGDDGVANFICSSPSECAYNPSYPATSPYVTAVGATYASSWADPGSGEIVCQSNVDNAIITSGGGFSTLFSAPSYQKEAINEYFQNVATQPVAGYAAGGRGYPDVALSGFGYQVVIGGSLSVVCGTSCSSPSVAGMASLVNAVRLEAGASPLGFLNPAIYKNAAAFNDITSGENQCTANAQVCCSQGFYASVGWDPTTGFGSVDYEKFKAALTADLGKEAVAAAEMRLAAKARTRSSEVLV